MTTSMLSLRVVSQMGNALAAPLQARFDAGGTIGRSPDCTLVLPDPGRHISREQARIERVGQGYLIRCTGSASAIVVNGTEVGPGESSPLRPGDTVIVAEYEIAVEQPQPAAQPPAAARPAAVPVPSARASAPRPIPPGVPGRPSVGTIDDPFAALGLAAPSSILDDPLAGFGLPGAVPVRAQPEASSRPGDLLGLGSPHQPILDSSRRASDNLDAMFDLAGASPDPLGLGSGLAGPASQPNTASSSDPMASFGIVPKAMPGALPDTTPEIAGSFRLPEAIPATNFGFGNEIPARKGAASSSPVITPAPVYPAPVSPAPGPRLPVAGPPAVAGPRAPTAAAAQTPPTAAAIPASAAFLSWNQPEEISPTITISKLLSELPGLPVPASAAGMAAAGVPAAAMPARPAGQRGGAEPLRPEQIRAIAEEIAERHRVDFEPPPKTRPTDFLNELNRAQVEALHAELARSKQARETSLADRPTASRGVGATASADLSQEQLEQVSFELLKGLLLGLGLSELPRPPLAARAPPAQLSPELMRRLGELIKVATQGTIDLLQARSTLKREMKTEVTLIASRDNNPLKFSPDAQAALAHLLSTQSIRGFLDPVPALKDSYDDLLAHQVGFIAGMRAAMQGLISRFDPAVLESRLTRKSVLDSMLPIGRKARLWELFSELFAEISREAEDDFEALFGREFVRAYEQQISRLHQDKS